MTHKFIKEFGQLVGVSVRTLHHYDKLGLLVPSIRLESGYRVYGKEDLFRLEQIMALKLFGFSLQQIKHILDQDTADLDLLKMQEKSLQMQVSTLSTAQQYLSKLIKQIESGKKLEWNTLVQLTKELRMKEDMKKMWEGVYTKEELDRFAEFGKQYTQQQMDAYQKRWDKLVARIRENMHHSTQSAVAQELVLEWDALVDEVWGKRPDLKESIIKAYDKGMLNERNTPGFHREIWEWIDEARDKMK